MRSSKVVLLLSLFLAAPAQAAVQFAANGAATVTAGTGACTPATTTLGAVGATDIVLLVVTGEHDRAAHALTTANGFVQVGSTIFGGDGDATEENPEIGFSVWWVRGSSWTAAPVVTDTGDHTSCALHRFTGAITTGDPWDVNASGNDSNANDTSASIPGATTTVPGTLVVLVQGTSNNATATTNCGAVTNTALSAITERFDSTNTSGLGGGHCLVTAQKGSIGTYGASTLTLSATTYKGAFSIALKPVTTAIQRTAQTVTAAPGGGAAVVLAMPGSVTSGNVVLVGCAKFTGTNNDPFIVGDITKTAGSSTVGAFQLDVGLSALADATQRVSSAVFSVAVTGTGTLTITVSVSGGDDGFCSAQEYSGMDASAWFVGSSTGSGTTGAPATGTVAGTDQTLFFGIVGTGTSGATTHTEGLDYFLVGESENGAAVMTGSVEDQVVITSTTDAADWAAPTTVGWVAVLATYQDTTEAPPACTAGLNLTLLGVGGCP